MGEIYAGFVSFMLESGIWFTAGLAVALILVIIVFARAVIITAGNTSDKRFTGREGAVILAAVIIAIAGFFCSYRDINSRGEDYRVKGHPAAFETVDPDAWEEIKPCLKENCWDNEWSMTASNRRCILFDEVHEYEVLNCETDRWYHLEYYDARNEETISRYIQERLDVHREYGDTAEYTDEGVTLVTASDDPSTQWAYVRYGDRLEVIQIVNAGDISEYTDAVMEDVRRQYTGQGNR